MSNIRGVEDFEVTTLDFDGDGSPLVASVMTINLDELDKGSVLVMSNGREPYLLSKEKMFGKKNTAVDDVGPLRLSCTYCHSKPAADARDFPKCAKCLMAPYCCKQCQKDDWPRHKPICREQREQQRAAALALGKV
ncbi:hypothetical protein FISHEDRAFT_70422 [Fistulina hepatica ATCC 64428]|uniref:MYND-type domain-containing protein n=1 Tax=Fistulina hepatica ATCC 64428 TaxID=1128425 RepID=A0A0D7AKV0_9AGAR|nr:hypothetical protein FISHEDRAFT_70422 [Fistulina hepatica ATCC 64428]